MKKNLLTKSLAIGLAVALNAPMVYALPQNAPQSSVPAYSQNAQEIDEGIRNLEYDNYAILANDGQTIDSFKKTDGIKTADKFVVLNREKKSITSTPVDLSIVDSIVDRTYPGALQFANKNFVANKPDLLVAPRKPIQIFVDLPGLGAESSVVVDNPNYSNISAAIDEIVKKWDEKCSGKYTIPARSQYNEYMVHSKSQISAALNVDVSFLENNLGIDFNAIKNGEKQVMIATYKQIFYTVTADIPGNPSDLFADSVTFSQLEAKGVNKDNPPLMVSNVAYGRTIYVKLETSSKDVEVEQAFSAALQGNTASVKENAKYNDILNNSDFTAVVLGGGAQSHNRVVSKNIDEIKSVIKENAVINAQNPGYPISYTSVFLKDNSIAQVKNKTEYIETTATEYRQGKINLLHKGAYVAHFNVSWDEISYDEGGKEVLTHVEWADNDKGKTARYSTVINLPANATNINIYAKERTGLVWDKWRVVVDERNLPLTSEINVAIWGTTLHPKSSVEQK